MNAVRIILFLCVSALLASQAAPARAQGEAEPLHLAQGQQNSSLSISVGVDGVGDQVSHEPHLDGGGFAPAEHKARYFAKRIGLHWKPTDNTNIRIGFTSHTISAKRDRYGLDSWDISLRQKLPIKIDWITLSLGASVGANLSQELTKTSFTRYQGWLVTRASLQQASDRHLQLNLYAERYLGKRVHAITYIGLGQAITRNKGFDGIVQDEESCRYNVTLNEHRNSVSLLEPCGQIQSFRQEFATRNDFEEQYSFDTQDDFTGETRYWQLGAQITQTTGKTHYGFGYHFQSFDRGVMDSRLQDRGGMPLVNNHTANIWWHYQYSPRWIVETGAQYSLYPKLDRLYVLYTGFTNERFSTSALIFNLSARYLF